MPILEGERHLAVRGWQKPGVKGVRSRYMTQGVREGSLEEGVSKPRPEGLEE